jgi:hypothetical protein
VPFVGAKYSIEELSNPVAGANSDGEVHFYLSQTDKESKIK